MINLTPRSFYARSKTTVTISVGGWGVGAQNSVWTFCRRDKSLAPTGIRAPDRPTRSTVAVQNTAALLPAFLKQGINIRYYDEGRSEGLGQKHFKNILKTYHSLSHYRPEENRELVNQKCQSVRSIRNTDNENTKQKYKSHHQHRPPWIRSFDLFWHRRIAIVSCGVHDLFFLEVCS